MLSHDAIENEVKRGSICVDGCENKIGMNSILVTLGDTVKVYDVEELDVTSYAPTKEIPIDSKKGLILEPNILYIGRTFEFTKTYGFVPVLCGLDELAVLGMEIHITAGFGDNGFEGTWTLEIVCKHPVRVYQNMPIGRIFYNPLIGKGDILYRGKYYGQIDPTESRLSEEYNGRMKVKNVNN